MTYKDICVKKSWVDKNGNEEVRWLKVGTYKETDKGKQFVEFNIFPNTVFYIFDKKRRSEEGVDF